MPKISATIAIILVLAKLAWACIWCYQCNEEYPSCNNSDFGPMENFSRGRHKSCNFHCPKQRTTDMNSDMAERIFDNKICGFNAISFLRPDNGSTGSACVTFHWATKEGLIYTTKACKGESVNNQKICKYLKEKCTSRGFKFISCSSCCVNYCNIGHPVPDSYEDDDGNDVSAKENDFSTLSLLLCLFFWLF